MQQKFSKHSEYLETVKQMLKADFVGWITEKENKFLKIKVKGKEFLLPLQGEEINHETYRDLIMNLLNKQENETQGGEL